MTDKEKILKYLEIKGISKNKFYQKTGLSVGFLDSGNSLGVDKLRIIIDNYHDLSIDWLLTGKGEMLKSNNISQSSVGNNNVMVGHDINGNISVEKIHGDNNTHIAGNGNHVNNATTLQQALNEISEQRKLVAKSQQQIDRLLAIIEHMTK